MENVNNSRYGIDKVVEIYVNTLDIFAPHKKRYLRGNSVPFMNTNVVNAYRKQTRMRNKFLKNRIETVTTSNAIPV